LKDRFRYYSSLTNQNQLSTGSVIKNIISGGCAGIIYTTISAFFRLCYSAFRLDSYLMNIQNFNIRGLITSLKSLLSLILTFPISLLSSFTFHGLYFGLYDSLAFHNPALNVPLALLSSYSAHIVSHPFSALTERIHTEQRRML